MADERQDGASDTQARRRSDDWQRPRRARSEAGDMNIIGPSVKARRLQLNRNRTEFIKDLSNASGGRWAPSVADLLNIERMTRTVTDIELAVLAAALNATVDALMEDRR